MATGGAGPHYTVARIQDRLLQRCRTTWLT